MPFRLQKKFRFEAAHRLPNHDGKCQRLHGHSWVGTVTLEDHDLHSQGPKAGMVMDFGDVKAALSDLLENYLDHCYLNESVGLANPTSEELARWVYYFLKPKLRQLVSVTIEETCTSAAEYRPTAIEEIQWNSKS